VPGNTDRGNLSCVALLRPELVDDVEKHFRIKASLDAHCHPLRRNDQSRRRKQVVDQLGGLRESGLSPV
jgi:hypothetical protein